MATVIVGSALALIVAGVIWKMIRDKRSGKSCCSGNCAHCAKCRH